MQALQRRHHGRRRRHRWAAPRAIGNQLNVVTVGINNIVDRRLHARPTTATRPPTTPSTDTDVKEKGSPSHDTARTQISHQTAGPADRRAWRSKAASARRADDTGRYTAPIGGSPVISNETPYSDGPALHGAATPRQRPVRIAVGQIADYTGKTEATVRAARSPQGAALMAMTRAVQGRRPAGRALRHLGRRDGAEIRQQQADRRRQESAMPATSARSWPARSPAPTTTSSAASPS